MDKLDSMYEEAMADANEMTGVFAEDAPQAIRRESLQQEDDHNVSGVLKETVAEGPVMEKVEESAACEDVMSADSEATLDGKDLASCEQQSEEPRSPEKMAMGDVMWDEQAKERQGERKGAMATHDEKFPGGDVWENRASEPSYKDAANEEKDECVVAVKEQSIEGSELGKAPEDSEELATCEEPTDGERSTHSEKVQEREKTIEGNVSSSEEQRNVGSLKEKTPDSKAENTNDSIKSARESEVVPDEVAKRAAEKSSESGDTGEAGAVEHVESADERKSLASGILIMTPQALKARWSPPKPLSENVIDPDRSGNSVRVPQGVAGASLSENVLADNKGAGDSELMGDHIKSGFTTSTSHLTDELVSSIADDLGRDEGNLGDIFKQDLEEMLKLYLGNSRLIGNEFDDLIVASLQNGALDGWVEVFTGMASVNASKVSVDQCPEDVFDGNNIGLEKKSSPEDITAQVIKKNLETDTGIKEPEGPNTVTELAGVERDDLPVPAMEVVVPKDDNNNGDNVVNDGTQESAAYDDDITELELAIPLRRSVRIAARMTSADSASDVKRAKYGSCSCNAPCTSAAHATDAPHPTGTAGKRGKKKKRIVIVKKVEEPKRRVARK